MYINLVKDNGANPFDSLDILENSLASETKLENLFSDYGLNKYNPKDKLAMEHMKCWHKQHAWDLINSPKELSCCIGKIKEYLFTQKEFNNLPFKFVMNWEDPFSFDMFLIKDEHSYVCLEYKNQAVTFHPKENDFNINYDTFLTIRSSQAEEYCNSGLPYILIDKNLNDTLKTNQKALSYAIKYPWPKKKMELTGGRSLHLVDVKTLCKMLESKTNYLQLNIPYHERGNHNGKQFNGSTYAFSSELFTTYRIRE